MPDCPVRGAQGCLRPPADPLALPRGGEIGELVHAVVRGAALADDVPLPEREQARLGSAALHWLAADLVGLARADGGSRRRCLAACMNLDLGEEITLALAAWLTRHA